MGSILQNYEAAKSVYAELGVDTDKAMERLDGVSLSVHCWQIDDLKGFENPDAVLSGGIAAFGGAPGKPESREQYIEQIDRALGLIPGRKKLALHAVYLDKPGDGDVPRNSLELKHFKFWVDFAKYRNIGLDFNPTYFSHPKAEDGFTLSSANEEIRKFWVEHGICCREIGEYFGKELEQTCITNHWIPDGYKDYTVDKLSPRLRLKQSLDEIFARSIDPKYNIDSVESKLFGLGSESYVTGSHEFYSNYVACRKNCIICMDTGHFHPTEEVSAKLSSYLAFNQEILLHVSRPVRWDSDHVVMLDDETKAIMREIVYCNALDRVHVGLDFFDASINRIAATAIGARNAKKAMLLALLEPREKLVKYEHEGNFTGRLALFEELKSYPFGFVWDMYCEKHSVKTYNWFEDII